MVLWYNVCNAILSDFRISVCFSKTHFYMQVYIAISYWKHAQLLCFYTFINYFKYEIYCILHDYITIRAIVSSSHSSKLINDTVFNSVIILHSFKIIFHDEDF